MEFIHDRTSQKVRRTVNVVDGPILVQSTSSTGRKFRAEHVILEFAAEMSGDWRLRHASVSGTVLKKDGSDSQVDCTNSLYSLREITSPSYRWLVKLVEAMTPEGTPVFPFRLTGLENGEGEA